MESNAKVLSARLKVRSYELDSFGHVNNANFLNYLEFARGEFMIQNSMSFAHFSKWNAFPYVIQATIDFKSPAFCDDVLRINGSITTWKRASFTLDYEIFNETKGRLSAVAQTVMAFVNDKGTPVAIPSEFKQAFF